ncbi:protein tyrosine phosphatase [Lichenihabitans sp. Uapishka_5]|uniref:tyrosine phosphatase family protein n=1 Tax=Lichenihabitans sp. Uapishka_5 TaxID=3037302 RepID=UPI0029E805A0|nr:protein tyrosine phosphatase [Lichenihabitans sp. Uapishka_5]MDX7950185.1 protein tyrosine phosphatase [Lichenihabitans sp. Uapishka_5]
MSQIHVCPLAHVDAVLAASRAGWAVSLLVLPHRVPAFPGVAPERRLHLALSDIVQATPSYVLAEQRHIDDLLAFLACWDRAEPMLIHCYAGVSRSTAAAFIALCCLVPDVTEDTHARRLRAASPTATPNRHLVALADAALRRNGRMVEAVAAIGRGAECFEGTCFALDLEDAPATGALDGRPPMPA